MPLRPLSFASIVVAMLGCSKAPKPTPGAELDAAAAPVSRSVPSSKDASVDLVAEQRARVVDLVYATKTLVAVSSKVQNPRDYPEHLIDGKPDTAWNGETDDLKGWIAFRTPKDVHVDYVAMTVGFDKIAKDGVDLFLANHRIKRVRLTRDGDVVAEHTLDPENRGMQVIPVDKDGGEFKLQVLATVPGTNTKWRELVVSELHVMGKTPAITRGIGERPRVFIGSFDAVDNALDPPRKSLTGAFPDIATYCRTQRALVAPTLPQRMRENKERGMDEKLVPRCDGKKVNVDLKLEAPFLELAAAEYETGWGIDETLLVRTDAGWRDLPALELSIESHYDPGCFSIFRGAHLESASVVQGPTPVLLLRWSLFAQVSIVSYGSPDTMTIKLQACRIAKGDTLACDEPVPINEAIVPASRRIAWRKDAKYSITPDGHIQWLGAPSGPAVEDAPADAGP